MIKIGIDFDNTIAKYDRVFALVAIKMNLIKEGWKGSKANLKKKIIKEKGIESWKKLQGQVYGAYMKYAKLNSGFKKFILKSKISESRLFIISHKTKFGHYDSNKINLRNEALEWIYKKKIDKNIQIFFENTIEEKINRINSLNLDYFIDDLEIILNHKKLNLSTKKILINQKLKYSNNKKFISFENWHEIKNFIFNNNKINHIKLLSENILNEKIKNINKLSGRKNSKVFKIRLFNNKLFLVKKYPDDNHDKISRIERELTAINYLKKFRFTNIPVVYKFDIKLNILIMEFINGQAPKAINNNDLDTSLNFIAKLKSINLEKNNYPFYAAESCISFKDLLSQIKYKYQNLLNEKIPKYIKSYLKKNFWKNYKILLNDKNNQHLKNYYLLKSNNKNKILSPSDFGFHNSIRNSNKLYFIDFEYFGIDDPVKLVADFILHPGMDISFNKKKYWLNKIFSIFKKDIKFKKRLLFLLPFYCLRWSLIVLNIFKNTKVGDKDRFYLFQRKSQFLKAKQFCNLALQNKFKQLVEI